jgi:hypothetical protein
MHPTHLILIEGLSGMGKTTLARHLGQRIPKSRVLCELDKNHPIALGHDTHAPDYADHMVGQWRAFVDGTVDAVSIIESRFWQNTALPMFRNIYTPTEVRAYHYRVIEIIRPLNPVLIFLATPDVRAPLHSLYEMRGEDWIEWLLERDMGEPWYQQRNLSGFNGWAQCFAEGILPV